MGLFKKKKQQVKDLTVPTPMTKERAEELDLIPKKEITKRQIAERLKALYDDVRKDLEEE